MTNYVLDEVRSELADDSGIAPFLLTADVTIEPLSFAKTRELTEGELDTDEILNSLLGEEARTLIDAQPAKVAVKVYERIIRHFFGAKLADEFAAEVAEVAPE